MQLNIEHNFKCAHHDKHKKEYIIETTDKKINLTRREAQHVFYLMQGLSNKLIARELNISPRTVESFMNKIRSKANCFSLKQFITMVRNYSQIIDWDF